VDRIAKLLPPDAPTSVTGGNHGPTFKLGSQAEVSGRLTTVETNPPPALDGVAVTPSPVLQLDLGRGEAVCVFPVGADIGGVQVGDMVTIVGRVEDSTPGRVYLSNCKLIPAARPPN
jgi:hypothetical protein